MSVKICVKPNNIAIFHQLKGSNITLRGQDDKGTNSRQKNGAKKNHFIESATYNIHLFFSRDVVVSVTIQSAAHSPHAV